jgi:protein-S-isoprenylcysteine O-methyltransferase Ste14
MTVMLEGERKKLIIRTIIIGFVFVGTVVVIISLYLSSINYEKLSFELGIIRYSGFIPLIIGAYISLYCVKDFIIQGKGTPAPFDPPKELVVKGFYKYLRNPMYFGLFLFILGEVLIFSSIEILIYLLLLIIICNLFVIFYEEPKLLNEFGDSYKNYCKEVSRWIPSMKKRNKRKSSNQRLNTD